MYYLPDILEGKRDPNCHMNTAFANAMFAWVLMGLNASFNAIFLVSYQCKKRMIRDDMPSYQFKEYVEYLTKLNSRAKILVNIFGFTIFFFWSQIALWPKNSSACDVSNYDSIDKLNWYILLAWTSGPALLLTFALLCFICCLPWLIKSIHGSIL